jgi:heme-binding NEAT domain protein
MTSTLDIKNTQQWSVPSNGKIYFSFGLNNSTWVNPLNFDENSKAEIV